MQWAFLSFFNALSGVTMEEDALPREASGGQEEVN